MNGNRNAFIPAFTLSAVRLIWLLSLRLIRIDFLRSILVAKIELLIQQLFCLFAEHRLGISLQFFWILNGRFESWRATSCRRNLHIDVSTKTGTGKTMATPSTLIPDIKSGTSSNDRLHSLVNPSIRCLCIVSTSFRRPFLGR